MASALLVLSSPGLFFFSFLSALPLPRVLQQLYCHPAAAAVMSSNSDKANANSIIANKTTGATTTQGVFQLFEDAKRTGGRFLKLAPGEKRTMQFDVNKIAIVDSEFQGKKTGGKTIQFIVIDPNDPQNDRVLSMGVRKTEVIMALLKVGKTLLDIQKIGTGKASQFVAIPL